MQNLKIKKQKFLNKFITQTHHLLEYSRFGLEDIDYRLNLKKHRCIRYSNRLEKWFYGLRLDE